jgi:putative hemolysin
VAHSVATLLDRARQSPRAGLVPDLDETHGRYRLRFAHGAADLDGVFRLRFEVFNLELGEGLAGSASTRRDVDPFDAQCHHLLVEHDGRTVGTYRLQVRDMALAGRGFYSDGEFHLPDLPPSVLAGGVELGRACVAREHRQRAVLYLLWRGLAAYLLWHGKRCFFGCSSLTSRDPAVGVAAWQQLQAAGHAHPELRVSPRPGFRCEGPPHPARIELPSLFRTYLGHGARVLGPPAIDREFGTIDFLTLLDVRSMDERTFLLFAHGLQA